MFTLAMLPIVACTTFGFRGSAHPSPRNMSSMPNQSAILIMVPRLPGSCTASSAMLNLWGKGREAFVMKSSTTNSARTDCGVFSKLALQSSSAEHSISTSAYFSATLGYSAQSVVATIRRGRARAIMSATIFGPSATNSPSSQRPFLFSSECISFIFALLIMSVSS